ncbi:hypothetical protein ACF0H5_020264 [Mactra antiquata]
MVRIVFITGIVAVSLIAICDGQLCADTPSICFPIKQSTSCVTPSNNGTGISWNEMQNVCQGNKGRLARFKSKSNFTILHLLRTSIHSSPKGSLVVLGLLSSTVDKVGLFWASVNDTSSYQCTPTETAVCMPSSNEDKCSAIGCCWRNGKCQYPNSQHLSVFNQSVEYYNISDSDQRQCVGYQLNNDSTTQGHWVTYDCFQPLDNAAYACEYKCNTTVWPSTTMTDFTYGEEKNNSSSFDREPTHQRPKSTTLKPKENHMNLESTLTRLINVFVVVVLLVIMK